MERAHIHVQNKWIKLKPEPRARICTLQPRMSPLCRLRDSTFFELCVTLWFDPLTIFGDDCRHLPRPGAPQDPLPPPFISIGFSFNCSPERLWTSFFSRISFRHLVAIGCRQNTIRFRPTSTLSQNDESVIFFLHVQCWTSPLIAMAQVVCRATVWFFFSNFHL